MTHYIELHVQGGISISKSHFDHFSEKLALEPVFVFEVMSEKAEKSSVRKGKALPLK